MSSRAIPVALEKKIGELLFTNIKMLTYPKLTVRAISNNFSVQSRISPEQIKTSTTGNKLGLLTKKL